MEETRQDRLLRFAREMRRSPTRGERWLWDRLRRDQLKGARFYRQRRIYPYIVDFFCPEVGLVIELDGAGHETQVEYDLTRKAFLESRGFTVLRFGSDISICDGQDILILIRDTIDRLRADRC